MTLSNSSAIFTKTRFLWLPNQKAACMLSRHHNQLNDMYDKQQHSGQGLLRQNSAGMHVAHRIITILCSTYDPRIISFSHRYYIMSLVGIN